MNLHAANAESRASEHLLTTKEAAAYLGMSPAFLERDRWAGAKIPYVVIGTRTIRYRQRDLARYVASRSRRAHAATPEAQGSAV